MKLTTPATGAAAGAIALAIILSGCSGTTYGTGVSPGRQTVKDITGLVNLGAKKDENPIEYTPRPAIVTPPSADTLPKPGEGTAVANWPDDPDEAEKRRKAALSGPNKKSEQELLAEYGELLPQSKPVGLTSSKDPNSAEVQMRQMREVRDEAEQLFAKAKSGRAGAVDADGNPVRTTLTEPPAEYRLPDAAAPEEFAAAKDEKWWQVFRRKGKKTSTPEPAETPEATEAAAPAEPAPAEG